MTHLMAHIGAPMWATEGRVAQGANVVAGGVAGRADPEVATHGAPRSYPAAKIIPVEWIMITAS